MTTPVPYAQNYVGFGVFGAATDLRTFVSLDTDNIDGPLAVWLPRVAALTVAEAEILAAHLTAAVRYAKEHTP